MPSRIRYVPVISTRLRYLLLIVLLLFALIALNSTYLSAISYFEWQTGKTLEDFFYQVMFLMHLLLGLLLVLPVIIFGILHLRKAWARPNRRAVRAGLALFVCALLLLFTGIALTRFGALEIKNPVTRRGLYWLHVILPLAVVWLFVLHRLAGKRINWKAGLRYAAFTVCFALIMLMVRAQDPRQWNVTGPASSEQYFFPSLARTATGNFIPAKSLMKDEYCQQCHQDTYHNWLHSAHHYSSFNNPAYLFSV